MTAKPAGRGALRITRRFTVAGDDPYSTIEWEKRTALITGAGGEVVFTQADVEVPRPWSQLATNVVASKYFHGPVGSPSREWSVRQLISRVVEALRRWANEARLFGSPEDVSTFADELTYALLHQMVSFNSPVWFNVGVHERPQASACQPYDSLVMTMNGPQKIGDIVERRSVGLPVFDGSGLTQVCAVKANGAKEVFRIELSDGFSVDATADHLVCAHDERRTQRVEWRRVDQLEVGMVMRVYPHAAQTITPSGAQREVSEAALAGWLQADGFVGQYDSGTNRSLTIEFLVSGDDELAWVMAHLKRVFPDSHSKTRDVVTQDATLGLRRIRLYGESLRAFVDKYELLRRGTDIRVPQAIWNASNDAVAAYLRSVFQAEGYVSSFGQSSHVALAVISREWIEDLQVLMLREGIYSRVRRKNEARPDRHDLWELDVSIASERRHFARRIGFISRQKRDKLERSVAKSGKVCPSIRYPEIVAIRSRGVMPVYDIQTTSGCYLSSGVLVHNCFINSVEDSLPSILELAKTEALLFKYGSGTGTNLSPLRGSMEPLSGGGTASGPVSFMRGFDAFAGVIKSGGKTRRAAKMVLLDVDHPDILPFIRSKADEEKKAWALIDAGYGGTIDGEAYASVAFQNANHSVRVSDAFMHAVEEGKPWSTTRRTDGAIADTYDARVLMREMAAAAHLCGDPGLQFDTTINAWHTSKATDRIYASNPCSEFIYLNDTACNLASLNLMKFRVAGGGIDVEGIKHVVDLTITAQELIVDAAGYPTPKIAERSRAFRPLGLGYANLGALLMAKGLAYDSDAGRGLAAVVTAIICGEAYAQSARLAEQRGPFAGFAVNATAMREVMSMHLRAVDAIADAPRQLVDAARGAWIDAVRLGNVHGYRNAQATVIAPTGTIGFMMDCDTTGVEPDIALVKYKKLVGGGVAKIVNTTVPLALAALGYDAEQVARIVAHIDARATIEGAADLAPEHLAVFDCAFTPEHGRRSIAPMGHLRMMAAVQPFVSGAISKTVNLPAEATVDDVAEVYMEAWKLGLKAIAIYRDGAKRVQPLATKAEQPVAVAKPELDVPPCNECGTAMVRSGGCFRCLNCGTVNGCS